MNSLKWQHWEPPHQLHPRVYANPLLIEESISWSTLKGLVLGGSSVVLFSTKLNDRVTVVPDHIQEPPRGSYRLSELILLRNHEIAADELIRIHRVKFAIGGSILEIREMESPE